MGVNIALDYLIGLVRYNDLGDAFKASRRNPGPAPSRARETEGVGGDYLVVGGLSLGRRDVRRRDLAGRHRCAASWPSPNLPILRRRGQAPPWSIPLEPPVRRARGDDRRPKI
jgi:hypothetical protein